MAMAVLRLCGLSRVPACASIIIALVYNCTNDHHLPHWKVMTSTFHTSISNASLPSFSLATAPLSA